MKRIIFLAAGLCGLLNAGMLPGNVLKNSSLSQENGGVKAAIDAYTDGGGVLLINQAADSKFDNSPMNKLVFKFGEEAKKNSVDLAQQVQTISTTSSAQEKILAGSVMAIVSPSCTDITMSWNGGVKLCEKGGITTYSGTYNNNYSCPSGGTLSGSTCLKSSSYTATPTLAGYTITASSNTNYYGMGLFKNGNTFRFCWDTGCGAYVYMLPSGQLSANTVGGYTAGLVNVTGGFAYQEFGAIQAKMTMSGVGISNDSLYNGSQGFQRTSATTFRTWNTGGAYGANISWEPFYTGAYTCPSGGTLSGTTCTINQNYTAANAPYYTCPSGGALSGITCTINTYSSAPGICQIGYSMDNFQCYRN